MDIRRQLTLFVDPEDAGTIEQVRREYNPIQYELIRSHVTLCREDEIQDLEQVIANLLFLRLEEIFVEFGKAVRFDNGKGLLLPAATGNPRFHELRREVLIGLNNNPRMQEPHITLMHPRNSTCTDEIFLKIRQLSFPVKLKFKRISLIEQKDGGPWKILHEFALRERI